jgi:hypothetical protein
MFIGLLALQGDSQLCGFSHRSLSIAVEMNE